MSIGASSFIGVEIEQLIDGVPYSMLEGMAEYRVSNGCSTKLGGHTRRNRIQVSPIRVIPSLKTIKLSRRNGHIFVSITTTFEHRPLPMLFFSSLSLLNHLQHFAVWNVFDKAPIVRLSLELFLAEIVISELDHS
jgi:hypothetical protein